MSNPALDNVRTIWFHDLNEFHYELPTELLREFCNRIRQDGMDSAWEWFVENVDYDGDSSKPIKDGQRISANTNLCEIALDHDYPEEFLSEAEDFLSGAD